MESSHCPWHAADLDGLYVVRDKNNKSIVEHSNEWTREEKVRHVLLMAAAPELLLSLCEMVLLAHDKTGEKGFETTPADWQIGIARAQKAIRNTEKSFQET